MSTDHNIFGAPGGDELSEEKIAAYFAGTLSETERWEVEQWLSEPGAESDAIEGLQQISPEEAQRAKRRINAALQHNLLRKKPRRKYINNQKEVWIVVVTVLLLIMICFGVMWWMKQHPAGG